MFSGWGSQRPLHATIGRCRGVGASWAVACATTARRNTDCVPAVRWEPGASRASRHLHRAAPRCAASFTRSRRVLQNARGPLWRMPSAPPAITQPPTTRCSIYPHRAATPSPRHAPAAESRRAEREPLKSRSLRSRGYPAARPGVLQRNPPHTPHLELDSPSSRIPQGRAWPPISTPLLFLLRAMQPSGLSYVWWATIVAYSNCARVCGRAAGCQLCALPSTRPRASSSSDSALAGDSHCFSSPRRDPTTSCSPACTRPLHACHTFRRTIPPTAARVAFGKFGRRPARSRPIHPVNTSMSTLRARALVDERSGCSTSPRLIDKASRRCSTLVPEGG